MIVFRYLAREVLTTWVAVSLALLVIIVAGRFGKYLAVAASGEMAPSVVFALIYYRLPGFLELILPLAFFIAVLLAYGRMYVDSEMTVLSACGMSPNRVLGYTLGLAMVVAVAVAGVSLWLTPVASARFEAVSNDPANYSGLNALVEGRFQEQESKTGLKISYVEGLNRQRTEMRNVVIIDQRGRGERELSIMLAESARVVETPEGHRYLAFQQGRRYEGQPGAASLRVTEFDTFSQWVEQRAPAKVAEAVEALPTRELLGRESPGEIAALHWRLALPALLPVVAIVAAALARTNPRQGRYARMLPAIVLYLLYLVALNAGRNAVAKKGVDPVLAIWGVHAFFAGVSLLLWSWPGLVSRRIGGRGK